MEDGVVVGKSFPEQGQRGEFGPVCAGESELRQVRREDAGHAIRPAGKRRRGHVERLEPGPSLVEQWLREQSGRQIREADDLDDRVYCDTTWTSRPWAGSSGGFAGPSPHGMRIRRADPQGARHVGRLMNDRPRLSKSRYISGTQCHLRLWYDTYRRDLATAPGEALQAVFETGHEVGEAACGRFPRRSSRRSRSPARSAGAGGDTPGHRGGCRARGVRSRLRARTGAGARRRDRAPSRGRVAPGRGQVDHPAQGRLPARPRRPALGASRCRARRA